ncbi:Hypothetical_protein [Hexamita inflata]|uniref:Hypothetical_protein n=1 Tax=Hexamita inflata TaxID=28002 RepID=A0ABP1KS23_9EUKA
MLVFTKRQFGSFLLSILDSIQKDKQHVINYNYEIGVYLSLFCFKKICTTSCKCRIHCVVKCNFQSRAHLIPGWIILSVNEDITFKVVRGTKSTARRCRSDNIARTPNELFTTKLAAYISIRSLAVVCRVTGTKKIFPALA